MKNRVNFMCALALTASLASCAPTMQTPAGESYTPKTQFGVGMLAVQRVNIAAHYEQTPDSAYVEFPDCFNAVISVEDVRNLGVDKARDACRETALRTNRRAGVLLGVLVALGTIVGFFFVKFIVTVFGNL